MAADATTAAPRGASNGLRPVPPMRIAMVACSYYGSDARIRRAVDALVERGHQVDFFGLSEPGTKPASRMGPVRLHHLPMSHDRGGLGRYAARYGTFFAWAAARLSWWHLRRRYDLVYVHNMPNFLVFTAIVPKLTGAKVLLDVRDPVPELLASIRRDRLPSWLSRLTRVEERVSFSYSDAVITVSEPMRSRVAAATPHPREVGVVMNLPDPGVFVPLSEPAEPARRLVYSGTIAYRHGVDLAIEALALLSEEAPDLRLRLIGEGPEVESLLRLAQARGVADRVEFLGLVPHHELPALLQGSAAGISPLRADGFGALVFSMKVAEYIHLGLPVICADTMTMRHYFPGDEVMFFEPDDAGDLARAIRETLRDPEAAQRRTERGRRIVERLDWPTQRKELIRIIESLE